MKYQNPIIPGFHPDPSIFRDGEDFYLVTSSFEFFPGVPIFHSKNLVNWTQVGHVLDRESQVDLLETRASAGIYAPTIRKHENTWYMITTNVINREGEKRQQNFIVHAEKPEGPWSEPVIVDQDGIDPSLFFEDDGTCWYTGTDNSGAKQGIVLFQVNPMTGERLSEKKIISYGTGGKCPEGPHIYKKDGWYYLMLAEGGTEYGHMETIARSRCLEGPYEFRENNPLLSNRGVPECLIQACGHADLVEDTNGNWWIVCLGIRAKYAMLHHLGRETMMMPVTWKNDWPYVMNDGVVQIEVDGPLPQAETVVVSDEKVEMLFFEMSRFPYVCNWLRNPDMSKYKLTEDGLHLYGTESISSPTASPTWMGIRQTQFETETQMTVSTALEEGTVVGLSAFYMHSHHYDIGIMKNQGKMKAFLRKRMYDMEICEEQEIEVGDTVTLKIRSAPETYTFAVQTGTEEKCLGTGMTAGLSTEITEYMTFTGVYYAAFAENGEACVQRFTVKSK